VRAMALRESFGSLSWVDAPQQLSVVGRLGTLDALRGLAVLLVTLMHGREILWIGMSPYLRSHPFEVTPSSLVAYALAPLMYGAIGVSLLFVLSGYVIHRSVARLLDRGSFQFDGWAFAKRRFVRIYPTLILAILVTAGCDAIVRSLVAHPLAGDTGFLSLLCTLLGLQGVLAQPYGSNSPLWSLAIELQFYLVYPLALLVRRRVGMDAMLAIAVGVSLLGLVFLQPKGITAFPQYYIAWWIGAYIADREQAGRALPTQWPLFAVVFLVAGCVCYTLQKCDLGIVFWSIGLAPILAFVIDRNFMVLAANSGLKLLGRFSYTLYAVHFPILVLASAIAFGGMRQSNIVLTLGITLATIALSYGAYWLAERPSLRLLQSMRR
jgi:peptidoglycan/LPS O-acetylase OafA/YrhL